jgi:GntR family transcriptional regulator of arabinose operon
METPKYEIVVKWLRTQIAEDGLKKGDKLYSETKICQTFGFSRQTIRKAISVLEQEGLVKTVRGSGTYISANDTGKKAASKNIGIILTYLDDYVFPMILAGIESYLTENGYTMQLLITHKKVENEEHCLKTLLEKQVDGIIAEPTKSGLPNPNGNLYGVIRNQKIPILFLNSFYPELDFPHVSVNNFEIGKLAATELINNGHRHIAGIFLLDDYQGRQRYAGYADALKQARLELNPNNVLWLTTEDLGDLPFAFERILRCLKGCTALLCYNDFIAAKALDFFVQNNIKGLSLNKAEWLKYWIC